MSDINTDMPKAKQTVLGLYVTAGEAYAKWQAEPDKIIDVAAASPPSQGH